MSAEPGSDTVRDAMAHADGWFICRIGFVETVRAVGLSAGEATAKTVREEWPAFAVIEVDQRLVEEAAELASPANCAAWTPCISPLPSHSPRTICSSPPGTTASTQPPAPKDSGSFQKRSTDGAEGPCRLIIALSRNSEILERLQHERIVLGGLDQRSTSATFPVGVDHERRRLLAQTLYASAT